MSKRGKEARSLEASGHAPEWGAVASCTLESLFGVQGLEFRGSGNVTSDYWHIKVVLLAPVI